MYVKFIFADDLHEAKATVNEMNRRLHELELELRRLENERDELTAAYKEAEAVSYYWRYCFYSFVELKNVSFLL